MEIIYICQTILWGTNGRQVKLGWYHDVDNVFIVSSY